MFLANIYSANALDTKLIDYGFERSNICEFDIHNGKIALLTNAKISLGSFNLPDVIVMEKGEWERLPNYIGNDTSAKLTRSSQGQIHFDSLGNIWICGKGLYKYDGYKWAEYLVEGDPDYDYRRFERFCVDKYNNIWITSIVRFSTSESYSELFKFDGEKFISIRKFSNGFRLIGRNDFMKNYILSATSDGRVVLHNTIEPDDEDYEDGQYKDIYIFNQDLTYEKYKTPSPSSSKTITNPKVVSSIFCETDGKLWFPLGQYKWGGAGYPYGACCSGLSLLDGETWTVFNEDNGFETIDEDLYEPVYRMTKLSNDSYFLIGKNCYYIMDQNYQVTRYLWKDFFNRAEFIVIHSYFNGEKGYEFLNNFLIYPVEMKLNQKIKTVIIEDGIIYLCMDKGLMTLKESQLETLSVNEETNSSLTLYPNPATESIYINSDNQYITFNIVNSLGKVVSNGKYTSGPLSISGLASGIYFIKLEGIGQNPTILSFIKE